MNKVLDEFNLDIQCPMCEMETEHNVQKIDENGNGEFIGHWAKCTICEHIEDYSEEDLLEIKTELRDNIQ